MATPEKGSEAPPAEHRDDHLSDSSPPSGKECRTFRTHIAELLEAVTVMVMEFEREEPAVEERAPELRGVEHPVAVSRQWESSVAQPAHAAAILFAERGGEPAKRRLVAFKCRFQTNCDLAGWTEAEALRVLPVALDNDALVAFCTIPPVERATLQQAFFQMVEIY
ncbi:unnamed protein product [Lampetra planeri]